ncbi:hypothetical protein IMZ48_24890 [Candidatus Bathyarchaeota archaeon]|nr:hypothetical protein [Candidatus Bathyarchaeota archaeon]
MDSSSKLVAMADSVLASVSSSKVAEIANSLLASLSSSKVVAIGDTLWASLTLRGVGSLVGLWGAYRVTRAIYNISPFHPLSRFPGPKIAAVSYLYEAYYDWILVGRYGHVIKRMHDDYGA